MTKENPTLVKNMKYVKFDQIPPLKGPSSQGLIKEQKQPGIGDMEYNEEVAYNDINKMMRLDDRNRYFADNFRQEKAGGGIAGLSGGDKSGAAPTRGPQSQGLFSIRNNVKKR